MVWEGNKRQVFVGFLSKTLVKYFWALWCPLLVLWEQTTAEGQLPKKHLLPGAGGSGQTPTALSSVQGGAPSVQPPQAGAAAGRARGCNLTVSS